MHDLSKFMDEYLATFMNRYSLDLNLKISIFNLRNVKLVIGSHTQRI